MKLETNNVTVKKSQKELFQFLCKLENFEQLMPENIEKFEVEMSNLNDCQNTRTYAKH